MRELVVRFDEKGLIPAIIQSVHTGEILMLGYMNKDALHLTLASGLVTFWSRSRKELWRKGSKSGNILHLVELVLDCDSDSLLIRADPAGPTCHTGAVSCFHKSIEPSDYIIVNEYEL